MPHPQKIEEQVKVNIQEISCNFSDQVVMEIKLENNVPERTMEGNINIYQDAKQWTSEVTWYFTGYGIAQVTCDNINRTQNFRITYIENYPKGTYLDRTIMWDEVRISDTTSSTTSQAGALLTVENVRFYGSGDNVEIVIRNSGTTDAKIAEVYQGTSSSNLQLVSSVTYDPATQLVREGSSCKITFDLSWTSKTRYYFKVVTEEGLSIPFSEETGSLTFTFMETEQLTITKVAFGDADTEVNATVMNTGTTDVIISGCTVTGLGVTATDFTPLAPAGVTIAKGTTVQVNMTATGGWSAGISYKVELLSAKGNKFSYTATAPT